MLLQSAFAFLCLVVPCKGVSIPFSGFRNKVNFLKEWFSFTASSRSVTKHLRIRLVAKLNTKTGWGQKKENKRWVEQETSTAYITYCLISAFPSLIISFTVKPSQKKWMANLLSFWIPLCVTNACLFLLPMHTYICTHI